MEKYRIVIDTEGSDKGAATVVKGAALALEKYPSLLLTLVGDEEKIKKYATECGAASLIGSRIEIIHAGDVITNHDSPATALFQKPDSSLVRALAALSERDDLLGFISAGNTGALIAGAMRFLSTPERVRPALAAVLPAENGGETCLVDTGATIDCTAQMLLHFARLGRDFMKALHKIDSPRVALLSNGAESAKGNALVKETHLLLDGADDVNFVGNVEGTNALTGSCDVLVADGFSGNVLLKTTEGTARRIITDIVKLANETGEERYLELAYRLKGLYDFNSMGGAVILGVRKPVFKMHGSSNEQTVVNTVGMLTKMFIDSDLASKKETITT
ncbi:MAG: phosphate acyltransferase PlsX [Clostridia bacterium]|nr:phosphate acyltransferase PlsX [Clostridia bacterium]